MKIYTIAHKRIEPADLTGRRFDKLVVLCFSGRKIRGSKLYDCKCDCGNLTTVKGASLVSGNTSSCGRQGCICSARGQKTKTIVGQRFGKLITVKHHGNGIWLCKCDCGNETITRVTAKSKSCGCFHPTRKESGEASFNSYLRGYKMCAKRRNREFALTDDNFRNIINQNCHYCGRTPQKIAGKKTYNGIIKANGVDRCDNNLGYTFSNCRSCCKTCNIAKYTMTASEYIAHCQKVIDHNNGKVSFD